MYECSAEHGSKVVSKKIFFWPTNEDIFFDPIYGLYFSHQQTYNININHTTSIRKQVLNPYFYRKVTKAVPLTIWKVHFSNFKRGLGNLVQYNNGKTGRRKGDSEMGILLLKFLKFASSTIYFPPPSWKNLSRMTST